MKTICPHCRQEFPDIPDEYQNMSLECPVCRKEFVCRKPKFCPECGAINPAEAMKCAQCGKIFLSVARQQPTVVVPNPVQEPSAMPIGKKTAKKKKNDQPATNSTGGNVKTVIVIIFVIAFFYGGICELRDVCTDRQLSARKIEKKLKSTKMEELFGAKNFIYHGAEFKNVVLLRQSKDLEKTFMGTVTFARCGRTYHRPIFVSYEKYGPVVAASYAIDSCGLNFDYSKNPEFLKEDADIIVSNLIKSKSSLASYSFVSAENLSPGVIRCIVREGSSGRREQVDIKVTTNIDFSNPSRSKIKSEVIASKNLP